MVTAPVSWLSHSSPPFGPLEKPSSSHTGSQVQMSKYTRVTFLLRTLLPTGPTPPPCPRTVSPGELQVAPDQSFLVEIQRLAHRGIVEVPVREVSHPAGSKDAPA